MLTLWVDSPFTRSMLNKPAVLEGLSKAASETFGTAARTSVVVGQPPAEEPAPAPAPEAPAAPDVGCGENKRAQRRARRPEDRNGGEGRALPRRSRDHRQACAVLY